MAVREVPAADEPLAYTSCFIETLEHIFEPKINLRLIYLER